MPRYEYDCTSCHAKKTLHFEPHEIERRDAPMICATADANGGYCQGRLRRSFSSQLRNLRIQMPKAFCESTAADFLPTHAERDALEKSWENYKMPERKPNAFAEARKRFGNI
jgi:hypothetical protein